MGCERGLPGRPVELPEPRVKTKMFVHQILIKEITSEWPLALPPRMTKPHQGTTEAKFARLMITIRTIAIRGRSNVLIVRWILSSSR